MTVLRERVGWRERDKNAYRTSIACAYSYVRKNKTSSTRLEVAATDTPGEVCRHDCWGGVRQKGLSFSFFYSPRIQASWPSQTRSRVSATHRYRLPLLSVLPPPWRFWCWCRRERFATLFCAVPKEPCRLGLFIGPFAPTALIYGRRGLCRSRVCPPALAIARFATRPLIDPHTRANRAATPSQPRVSLH